MNAYKVSATHAWGNWRDFTFVYAQSKKQALLKALEELDLPEVANEKIVVTVSLESPVKKKRKSRKS